MAIELVNIGRIANDGTGDDLREAFAKVNRSLEELDLRIDDKTEGSNVGIGPGQVFRRRDGYNLEFKTILGSTGLSVVNNETNVTLNLDTSIVNLDVAADTGSFTKTLGQTLTLRGGNGVSTSADPADNSVSIDISGGLLENETAPALNADLSVNNNSIFGANTITANNVQSLVHNIDIRDLNNVLDGFDFGDVGNIVNTTNFIDYIKVVVDVDMGTLTAPDSANIDMGTITN